MLTVRPKRAAPRGDGGTQWPGEHSDLPSQTAQCPDPLGWLRNGQALAWQDLAALCLLSSRSGAAGTPAIKSYGTACEAAQPKSHPLHAARCAHAEPCAQVAPQQAQQRPKTWKETWERAKQQAEEHKARVRAQQEARQAAMAGRGRGRGRGQAAPSRCAGPAAWTVCECHVLWPVLTQGSSSRRPGRLRWLGGDGAVEGGRQLPAGGSALHAVCNMSMPWSLAGMTCIRLSCCVQT